MPFSSDSLFFMSFGTIAENKAEPSPAHTCLGGAHIFTSVSVSEAASLFAGFTQRVDSTWHSPKYLLPLDEFTAEKTLRSQ